MKQQSNSPTKRHLFFWFMGLMGKRLPIYLAAILVSTGGMALGRIANAWMVEEIVTAAQKRNAEGVVGQVVMDFLVFVLGWCLWRMGIIQYNIAGRRSKAEVEKMVFSKALRLPYSYYENHHSGDFLSKLIFDLERAGDIYTSRLRRLLASVLSAVIYLIPMLVYSPQLTVCLFGVSVLSFAVNSLFLKPMKEAGSRLARDNSRMTENLTNILSGMELAKLFPAGRRMLLDYQEANCSCYDTQKRANMLTAALEGLNRMFDLTGALAFLGLGVWFVGEGLVTLGELTAVYTIYGSFRYMFLDIGKYLPQMMNCIAHVECLYDFLQLEEEPETYVVSDEIDVKSNSTVDTESCILEMKQVAFSYRKDRKLLENFSLKVPRGKCVALVGESGCGKSTIAKLLLGFYAPEKGYIHVGEGKAGSQKLTEIRDRISYVPQEPYLFGVSIAENIAYGRSDVKPEEVPMEDIIRAAKIANAHEFISRLPQGYQTIPGERGNTLSGGERQRIAIARAVIRNAPVLLLDEATSALDNESEKLVNEALDRVCRDRTTIMIAHRQSTIAMADWVVTVG